MKYECDIHIHSAFSPDAQDSPEKIVRAAKRKRLKAVAIADHNGTLGLERMKAVCRRNKMETVEAIEISSRFKGIDMHILGYSLAFNKNLLKKNLSPLIKGYNLRAKRLLIKCQQSGLIDKKINFEKYFVRRAKLYVPIREIHALAARQNKISLQAAQQLMARGTKLFVKMPSSGILSPQKTTKLIRSANGLSVIAHPYYIVRNPLAKHNPLKYLREIITAGRFDGIEVYYPKHTRTEEKMFLLAAKQKNLIITGGSDWHGKDYTPDNPIGCRGVDHKTFKKLIGQLKKVGQTAD